MREPRLIHCSHARLPIPGYVAHDETGRSGAVGLVGFDRDRDSPIHVTIQRGGVELRVVELNRDSPSD